MIGIIHANWNCTQSILIWCKLVMLYTYKEHFISETVIRSIKCCNNWLIDLHFNIHDISEQINQYCFIYAWNQLFHGYNYIIYNVSMLTPTKILVSQNNQTYNGKKKTDENRDQN